MAIDFTNTPLRLTRTSASLHLMLYQAILLCIRPVVLQQVHHKLQVTNFEQQTSAVIQRLSKTCEEAAMKSLAILSKLKQDRTIARFGFFDLDATFSAAFVLIMLRISDETGDAPPPKILEACQVLEYLSVVGNQMATRRLNDIKEFCYHVWPNFTLHNQASHVLLEQSLQAGSLPAHQDISAPSQAQGDFMDHSVLADLDLRPYAADGALSTDFFNGAGDIYSCFNDPSLSLTGRDLDDWMEMSRILNTQ
ncbi:hypothetical protein AUEXF2481DRAFT_346317 [Aureobasidium subglaciale EXF-2481]|uniref:Transcription factor domain-containing protein n=1 Tax=Aureobasidium subglaciale (strain EXF-2481) TaxID=1043005 RepID=A0A074Y5M4_AURSE|nr:uncharacterized protein AUEXF2481DRAFT_346317 [Aureobasidium subglaciale EXF-2481]KEQ93025.1 hypothetical protein AUEXF2481DRAFT_346317 [Aureobasidium subglaciale EXF-2481]